MAQNNELSHIYIIRADKTNNYKVGRSHNLNDRMRHIQTGCPTDILPVGFWLVEDAQHLEIFLHFKLQAYQTRGEWFVIPKGVLRAITKELDKIKLPCACSYYCTGSEENFAKEFDEFLHGNINIPEAMAAPEDPPIVDRTELEGVALSVPSGSIGNRPVADGLKVSLVRRIP